MRGCFRVCGTSHSMCAPYDETLANVLQLDLTRFFNLNQRVDVKSWSGLFLLLSGWNYGSKPLLLKPHSKFITVSTHTVERKRRKGVEKKKMYRKGSCITQQIYGFFQPRTPISMSVLCALWGATLPQPLTAHFWKLMTSKYLLGSCLMKRPSSLSIFKIDAPCFKRNKTTGCVCNFNWITTNWPHSVLPRW